MGAPAPQPTPRTKLWQPLLRRDFRLLWIGETVSLLGDQCYFVALPWLVLQLTGSGLALGTVMMLAATPRAVFMLVGGATSDRIAPRTVMIASDCLRALVVGGITLLMLLHALRLWHLYFLSFTFGLVEAFFFPAWTTIIPSLVDKEDLEPANAVTQGSAQLAGLLGPTPAGLLISSLGTAAAFAIDAASFVGSATAFWLMRGEYPQPTSTVAEGAADPPPRAGLLRGIREGLRYAWGDGLVRAILIVIAAINLSFVGPFIVGAAALAHSRFSAHGATALGIMLSAMGGGAVVGTLVAGSIRRLPRRGRLLMAASLLFAAGMTTLAFAPNVWIAAAIVFPLGVGGGFTNIVLVSWLQRRSDPNMVGRLMSLVMLGSTGLQPFSFLIAGALMDWHLTAMFVGAGSLMFFTGLFCAVNPAVQGID